MTDDERRDAVRVGMMMALDFLGVPDGAPAAFALYEWGDDALDRGEYEDSFTYPLTGQE